MRSVDASVRVNSSARPMPGPLSGRKSSIRARTGLKTADPWTSVLAVLSLLKPGALGGWPRASGGDGYGGVLLLIWRVGGPASWGHHLSHVHVDILRKIKQIFKVILEGQMRNFIFKAATIVLNLSFYGEPYNGENFYLGVE